jgi:hypothetical protein
MPRKCGQFMPGTGADAIFAANLHANFEGGVFLAAEAEGGALEIDTAMSFPRANPLTGLVLGQALSANCDWKGAVERAPVAPAGDPGSRLLIQV